MSVRAEVVGVGTEILLGQIANTNVVTISRALAAIGVDCVLHVAVGDNEERIASVLADACARSDAVVVTGGLGPTQDDVTREAVARLTGRLLVRDPEVVEEIRARFARMGRAMPPANERQADRPEGALLLPNPLGTAPGFRVEHGRAAIFALPGVPHEMEAMLEGHVLPDLSARSGAGTRIVSRVVRTAGQSESGVADALAPVWDAMPADVTMAYLAGGGEVRVRLTAKGDDAAAVASALDAAERDVRARLGPLAFGVDDESLEVVAGRLLRARGWTLGVAESLTGGMVGARVTDVAGASDYFRGSIVAYSTQAKAAVLGVDPALLSDPGPVSAAVARAMASGARRALDADVGLATTGVAGPAEQDAPVGTVLLAVDGPLGAADRGIGLPGGRANVRALATTAALNLLRLYLEERLG